MPDDERAHDLLSLIPGFARSRCHGYANGCTCARCRRRERIVALHVSAGRSPYTPDGKLRPLPKRRDSDSSQPWQARPPRYQGAADMIDINTPAGAPPRDLLAEAVRELHGQVSVIASRADRPPSLDIAIRRATVARDMDCSEDLVLELRNVAHAALVDIVDVRQPEAAAPPRVLLDEALRELTAQISIYAGSSTRPPQLGPAITAARVARIGDDEHDLIRKLRDVAHGAVVSIVRVRAAIDHVPSP